MEHNLRDGLFFQPIVHTGLNPYLSVQMARALMMLGDARWFAILETLIQRASPTYTWPEAMHPRMFGGCMGDGDHGWSAAEFLNLIRDMLVSDHFGSLQLAQGAPAKWFKAGLHLAVSDAPTTHGTVEYSYRQGMVAASLNWCIDKMPHQDSGKAFFSLPVSSGVQPGFACPIVANAFKIELPSASGEMLFYAPNHPIVKVPVSEKIKNEFYQQRVSNG